MQYNTLLEPFILMRITFCYFILHLIFSGNCLEQGTFVFDNHPDPQILTSTVSTFILRIFILVIPKENGI